MQNTTLKRTLLLSLLLLSGCAAQQAYREGQRLYDAGKVEDGLSKMDEAYKLDPGQSDYRSKYFTLREATVFRWLNAAEQAKQAGNWTEAASLYQRVLKIDQDNPRAKTGLSTLATEQKQVQLLNEAQLAFNNGDLTVAAQNIRKVLIDSPSHPQALELQKIIDAKRAAANQPATELKAKLTSPISIEFKDANLNAVLDSIAKTASLNFMLDKDVRSDIKVTLFVRDSRIEDVLRFILTTNQLNYRILNNNTLYIYPAVPQKQKDYQELQVKNFYLNNASAKDVSTMLRSILKVRDLYVDERLNLIVMRDSPELIQVAERLVAAQDIADPEVMLEVEVLEVGTNLLDTIGIQYPSQISLSVLGSGGTSATTSGTTTGTTSTSATTPGIALLSELKSINSDRIRASITDPALVISLLHQNGDTKLLANPKIRAKNKEKAKIHIGEKLPVISITTTSTGVVTQSVTYLDVGLKLDVEPNVYLNNDVAIKVGLEVSSVGKQIKNSDGSLIYQIGTRNANTMLRLKDGETQILAGLINKEDRKAANGLIGLGDLPIIGRLFSQRSDTEVTTEIVLLITPRVIRNIVRPESPIELFSSGTESSISLERLEMTSVPNKTAEPVAKPVENKAQAIPQGTVPPAAVVPVTQPMPVQTKQNKISLMAPAKAAPQQTVTVNLNLKASQLKNAQIELMYNPQQLKILGINNGEFLKKNNSEAQFAWQINEERGQVSLSLNPQSSLQDEGELANINFEVLATGTTQISIASANLADANGNALLNEELPSINLELAE